MSYEAFGSKSAMLHNKIIYFSTFFVFEEMCYSKMKQNMNRFGVQKATIFLEQWKNSVCVLLLFFEEIKLYLSVQL